MPANGRFCWHRCMPAFGRSATVEPERERLDRRRSQSVDPEPSSMVLRTGRRNRLKPPFKLRQRGASTSSDWMPTTEGKDRTRPRPASVGRRRRRARPLRRSGTTACSRLRVLSAHRLVVAAACLADGVGLRGTRLLRRRRQCHDGEERRKSGRPDWAGNAQAMVEGHRSDSVYWVAGGAAATVATRQRDQ